MHRKGVFPGRMTLALATVVVFTFICAGFGAQLLVYNNSDANSSGSLRQAVNDNNALGGGNTIVFSNIVTGTIVLTNPAGQLLITRDVTIIGPGANMLSVSGNSAHRVFYITNGAVASISGLAIENGYVTNRPGDFPTGGGFENYHSTLTLSDCIIRNNSATVAAGGGQGGGGWNAGTLSLFRCSFIGNHCGDTGGGLHSRADFSATNRIANCTFTGNSAGVGGGIYTVTFAGTQSILLSSSTFSGNSASQGSCIRNTTETVEIGNNIFEAGTGTILNYNGTFISHGYNIANDSGGGVLTGVADQINTNPLLGPLTDNGGPTPTMMPAPNSPAIDQGKRDTVPGITITTDQRGRPRPFTNAIPPASLGDHSDVGAVEYSPVSLIVSNLNDNGPNSLRDLMTQVIPGERDVITFATNLAGTLVLASSELQINKSMSIVGPGPKQVSVSGNAASTVFVVNTGKVAICNLTITNGVTGIYNGANATLLVSNCVVAGNVGPQNAGGILNEGALTVQNSTICSNQAVVSNPSYVTAGGGLLNYGEGVAVFLNSTLAGNAAVSGNLDAGGAIFHQGDKMALTNCTIVGNSARYGGGLYHGGFSFVLAGCIAASNTSSIGYPDANGGSYGSGGYNLIGNTNGMVITFIPGQDQYGYSASPLNPLVAPLGYYGGATPTCPLVKGSPAIDKGKSFGLSTDQRGAPRPFDFASVPNASGGDGSDVGAVEFGTASLSILRAAPNIVLSWPGYYGDFTVESVTNLLSSSNSWTAVPGTPALAGNQFRLTNNVTDPKRFYRLKSL